MVYIKTFEGWGDDTKPQYYVQKGEGHDELTKIKTKILEDMNPPMPDVWEGLSDTLLDVQDKWGKFTNKYESERSIIEFSSLDLDVDISDPSCFPPFLRYTIASESDTFYNRGDSIIITDREKKEEYRKGKSYDSRLSTYGSSFDQRFYNFYKKMNGEVSPFYSFLIGVDSEYADKNPDDIKELTDDIVSGIKSSISRLRGKIVKISYFDSPNYAPSNNNWKKVSDLSQVTYPRISIGFKI